MKSQVLSFILLFFLSVNVSPQLLATEASPEVHSKSVQKEKRSFKERWITKWIQKKVEKTQQKKNKRGKGKGFPIDGIIGFALSTFATVSAALLVFLMILELFIAGTSFPYTLPALFFYALIAAAIGGILGLIAHKRLSKKEDSSRTGKVFAKIAMVFGFGISALLLFFLGIN